MLIQENGGEVEIIQYMSSSMSTGELSSLLEMLQIKPIQLVRKGEEVWKEKFQGKSLSDTELIQAMIEYPKLIERPIIVKNREAIIGRPPENVLQFFD